MRKTEKPKMAQESTDFLAVAELKATNNGTVVTDARVTS
jgi:hypothetical protein